MATDRKTTARVEARMKARVKECLCTLEAIAVDSSTPEVTRVQLLREIGEVVEALAHGVLARIASEIVSNQHDRDALKRLLWDQISEVRHD